MNNNSNTVMILDDKDTFILPLEIGLKKKGIEVISFTEPEKAIEYLKENPIDVLLTDYHMEPAINGDEVIRRVREFNKDIIIYLQTAYAETLPADEMLDKYEIQGYIDKNEGLEKSILLIKAGLKQADLIKLVKEQQTQLDAQSCKNEFLGKFLNRLMGEIGERSMAMAGSIIHLEEMENTIPSDNKETFSFSVNTIKSNTAKLNELIKSLEITEGVMINIAELKHILENLFTITMSVKDVNLNIKCENEHLVLECKRDIILHIIVEIVENIINNGEKSINILIENDENDKITRIKVCNQMINSETLDKLNKLAYLDDKINVSTEYEQVLITIG